MHHLAASLFCGDSVRLVGVNVDWEGQGCRYSEEPVIDGDERSLGSGDDEMPQLGVGFLEKCLRSHAVLRRRIGPLQVRTQMLRRLVRTLCAQLREREIPEIARVVRRLERLGERSDGLRVVAVVEGVAPPCSAPVGRPEPPREPKPREPRTLWPQLQEIAPHARPSALLHCEI